MPRRQRGELKAEILATLWEAGRPLTAKEVRASFDGAEHVPVLSTFLTILGRLHASGEVRRSSDGGEYTFAPVRTEPDNAVGRMLDTLMKSADRADVLLGFAGRLDERDIDLLRKALDGRKARR